MAHWKHVLDKFQWVHNEKKDEDLALFLLVIPRKDWNCSKTT